MDEKQFKMRSKCGQTMTDPILPVRADAGRREEVSSGVWKRTGVFVGMLGALRMLYDDVYIEERSGTMFCTIAPLRRSAQPSRATDGVLTL